MSEARSARRWAVPLIAAIGAISLSGCLVALDEPVYRVPREDAGPGVDIVMRDVAPDARDAHADATRDARDVNTIDGTADVRDVTDVIDVVAEDTIEVDTPVVTVDVIHIDDVLDADDAIVRDAGCTAACATGQMCCGGRCVSATNNEQNCGGCGIACEASEWCDHGTCTRACPIGNVLCSFAQNRCCTLLGVACVLGACPSN